MLHKSDCALHNEPAMPAGACDCTPWRSIYTAPMDGTWIWVWVPRKLVVPQGKGKKASQRKQVVGPRFRAVCWVAEIPGRGNRNVSELSVALEYKHGGYWTGDPKRITPLHGMPSHWMPLPPPPVDAAYEEFEERAAVTASSLGGL